MNERTETALAAAFPDRLVAGYTGTGPSWNPENETVSVRFADGGRAYLKAATGGNGERIARERAVLAFVGANREVSVPEVVACDPDAEVPYLATAPVDGEPFHSVWDRVGEEDRESLAAELGRTLARVHQPGFDAHGHVTGGDADGLDLDTAPWTDVLADTVRAADELAPSTRFPDAADRLVAAIERNRDLLDGAPAALLHGDPAGPNCVNTPTGIGLLDWELAHVGDPARDIYRTIDQQFAPTRGEAPESIVEAFHDGYRDVAGSLPEGYEARRPVYRAVRFLGVLGNVENYVEYLDESEAEFVAWTEAEFERRLDAL